MVTAVVAAAGKSERMGTGSDKAFLSLGPKPVVAWCLLSLERCPDVDQIVLVVRKEQIEAARTLGRMFGISKLAKVVAGGNRRQDSVMNGLKEMDPDTRIVVVHDGARPCTVPETVSEVVKLARRTGAAVVGHRVSDTIKRVDRGTAIARTEDRSKLWAVQTPQAFNASLLLRAYDEVAAKKLEVTDDAAAVEALGETVRIHECELPNMKITTVEDLKLAAAVLLRN